MSAIGFSGHAPVPFENKWSTKESRLEEYAALIKSLKSKYSPDLNLKSQISKSQIPNLKSLISNLKSQNLKSQIPNPKSQISNLKSQNLKSTIDIFLSLEIDFIPGITKEFSVLKDKLNLDYTIGSVHLVLNKNNNPLTTNNQQLTTNFWFIDRPDKNYSQGLEDIFKGDIKLAVTSYYRQIQEMVITQKPDIIGHFDKVKMNNKNRYFSEDEQWYKDIVDETLKIISKNNSILEVNTRGIYKKYNEINLAGSLLSGASTLRLTDFLFPSVQILEQCFKLKIPVTVNSDAHSPSELTNYFDETYQLLKDIGFKGTHEFIYDKWQLTPF